MDKAKLLKAYPFLEEVDGFSLEVALAIYKIRPNWLNIGKVREFAGSRFLSIEFQSPKHSDWYLWLDTDDHDVTVGYYNDFHIHFGRDGETIEVAVTNALNLMDELMREKWVVGYRFEGNHRAGRAYHVEEIPNMTLDKVHYIRSWLGTYDKNLLEA